MGLITPWRFKSSLRHLAVKGLRSDVPKLFFIFPIAVLGNIGENVALVLSSHCLAPKATMAPLEKRNQTYRIVFMYGGKRHGFSLGTGDRRDARPSSTSSKNN